ncbi:cytochrome P450 81Q32-like [Aristolochia californica]|uniref:cytochrome P450 81Q32-like n=1 Tax=Aristolochia californica TaxID=171875 RepID=UPI0035DB1729
MEWWFYLALIFSSLLVFSKRFLLRKKNLPPGPLSLPIIGHLHYIEKRLHRSLARLSHRYGPIMLLRFGSRPVLVISSPSAVEECFTTNDVAFANRPRLLAGKHLGTNYTTVVWAPYNDHWRSLRRFSGLEIFSVGRINMFAGIRSKEVRSLCRKLFESSRSGVGKMDMKSVFFELVFNIMSMITAGKRYFGEDVENMEDAEQYRQIVKETFALSGAANLGDYLPLMGRMDPLGLDKRLADLQRRRSKFLQRLIDERRSGDSIYIAEGKKTLIDVLLSLQQSDPEFYTDSVLQGIIVIMLTAGSDTSSVTLEWVLSLLLNNPEALNKAKAEIDSQVGHGRLLEESDLPHLPYLHSIINETLRLYPPGPLLVPHESSQDCTVGGYTIPRGTMLLTNLWAMNRDPSTWKEPTRFIPERFEGVEGETVGSKFIPFGMGRRRCPGSNLAMRLVALALGTLIQCFEWNRVGAEEVDMNEGGGLTMPKAEPLVALCSPRQTMVDVLSQLLD